MWRGPATPSPPTAGSSGGTRAQPSLEIVALLCAVAWGRAAPADLRSGPRGRRGAELDVGGAGARRVVVTIRVRVLVAADLTTRVGGAGRV